MWIIYGILTAIILASRKVQEKSLLGDVGGSIGWMIRFGSGISALALWVMFSSDISGLFEPNFLLLLCIIIFIFYPVYTIGYYFAMQRMELSFFGMLAPISILSNIIFSYFVFGKIPSFWGCIGIFLVILSIIMLFYKNKIKKDIYAIIVAIFTYIVLGIFIGLDKIGVTYVNPYLYTTLNQFGAMIILFILSFFLFSGPKIDFALKKWKSIFAIGLIQGVGWVISMLTIKYAPNTSYAVALINTHAIFTAIFGIFFLGEKFTHRKKIVFILVLFSLVAFGLA